MKNFLVGNFLPAYSGAFGLKNIPTSDEPDFDPEEKRKILERRARHLRKRRNTYVQRIQFALVVALLVTIAGFQIPLDDKSTFEVQLTTQELVEVEEVLQTQQQTLPPPPPRPPVPIAVDDDALIDDDDLDLDASLDLEAELELPVAPPPEPVVVEEEEEPEIFVVVQQMPELIGGVKALASSIKYPDLARRAGLEGTVVVQFIVQPDGTPSDPEVVKSVSESLDKAAVEAVLKQRFKPGMQRNKAVPVRMAMPVKFQLR